MIDIVGLKKRYGEKLVLDIDEMTIAEGERVALVGANGSGKSTLLKLIAGVITPSEGEITSDFQSLYMPQSSYAFDKSVLKNIMISGNVSTKEAHELLCRFELGELENKNAKNLSGGEKQRVALCRLLAGHSRLILLDEPTSEMDLHSTGIAENAILDYINKEKATLVFSTHSPVQAKRLADRIIILNNGRVAEDGSINETVNAPKTSWGEEFLLQWIIRR